MSTIYFFRLCRGYKFDRERGREREREFHVPGPRSPGIFVFFLKISNVPRFCVILTKRLDSIWQTRATEWPIFVLQDDAPSPSVTHRAFREILFLLKLVFRRPRCPGGRSSALYTRGETRPDALRCFAKKSVARVISQLIRHDRYFSLKSLQEAFNEAPRSSVNLIIKFHHAVHGSLVVSIYLEMFFFPWDLRNGTIFT